MSGILWRSVYNIYLTIIPVPMVPVLFHEVLIWGFLVSLARMPERNMEIPPETFELRRTSYLLTYCFSYKQCTTWADTNISSFADGGKVHIRTGLKLWRLYPSKLRKKRESLTLDIGLDSDHTPDRAGV
jgi:hypothetical protein